jgi:hypothetical protein
MADHSVFFVVLGDKTFQLPVSILLSQIDQSLSSNWNDLSFTVEGGIRLNPQFPPSLSEHIPNEDMVYLMRAGLTNLYKLGHTTQPKERLDKTQTHNHEKVHYVAMCRGGKDEEENFHKKYAARQVRVGRGKEWFELNEHEVLSLKMEMWKLRGNSTSKEISLPPSSSQVEPFHHPKEELTSSAPNFLKIFEGSKVPSYLSHPDNVIRTNIFFKREPSERVDFLINNFLAVYSKAGVQQKAVLKLTYFGLSNDLAAITDMLSCRTFSTENREIAHFTLMATAIYNRNSDLRDLVIKRGFSDYIDGVMLAARYGSMSNVEFFVSLGTRPWISGLKAAISGDNLTTIEYFLAKSKKNWHDVKVMAESEGSLNILETCFHRCPEFCTSYQDLTMTPLEITPTYANNLRYFLLKYWNIRKITLPNIPSIYSRKGNITIAFSGTTEFQIFENDKGITIQRC